MPCWYVVKKYSKMPIPPHALQGIQAAANPGQSHHRHQASFKLRYTTGPTAQNRSAMKKPRCVATAGFQVLSPQLAKASAGIRTSGAGLQQF